MIGVLRSRLANPRVRQIAIAIAVAGMVSFLTLLRPFDVALWSVQSKLFSQEPSGQIILVTDGRDNSEGTTASANRTLLRALERLEEAGASQIAIDTPLRRSRNADVDKALRDQIEAQADRIVIAQPVGAENSQNSQREPNAAFFDEAAPTVSGDLVGDFLHFVWAIDPVSSGEGGEYRALWTTLIDPEDKPGVIYPDFTIGIGSLPSVEISDLAQGDAIAMAQVRDRKVVIAGLGGDNRDISAPGSNYQNFPPAALHIIAAETHMRGAGIVFGALFTIPLTGLLLVLIAMVPGGRIPRRSGYALLSVLFVAAFFAMGWMGHRIFLAEPMLIGVIYAITRATANYRRRHLYIDAQSRLPNFTALRRDLALLDDLTSHVLVIAKIARLDAIFATLKDSEQGEYLRQVATRLRLGEGKMQVYHDGGKYLAMVFRADDYADIEGHLEGLRAVASQAVMIGNQPIDVAITIGVDQTYGAPMANRISSAIAAADQAREAYRPVFIISDFETDSEQWDHSLQSRLESALSENRISIKLQPKVEMQTGLFVGAEALARWTDQQHGDIPPNRFILQCERAGRLDELTKRVMKNSMDASRYLDDAGLPAKISVNVSAIQFVDTRIVDLVCMSLEETRASPHNMMIEITETARIENIMQARRVIEEIKAMGIGFSIDDFGVGSGNLAALYELPFDELKIDRMFADEVGRSTRARAVVDALLRLSRDLGIVSVAEGIEDLSTFEMVRDMGGDLAQGFCIARPQTLFLLEETLKLQASTGVHRVI